MPQVSTITPFNKLLLSLLVLREHGAIPTRILDDTVEFSKKCVSSGFVSGAPFTFNILCGTSSGEQNIGRVDFQDVDSQAEISYRTCNAVVNFNEHAPTPWGNWKSEMFPLTVEISRDKTEARVMDREVSNECYVQLLEFLRKCSLSREQKAVLPRSLICALAYHYDRADFLEPHVHRAFGTFFRFVIEMINRGVPISGESTPEEDTSELLAAVCRRAIAKASSRTSLL